MPVYSFKFPSKTIAHQLLYREIVNEEGTFKVHTYEETYDAVGAGIATERYMQKDSDGVDHEFLRVPSDGTYNADIRSDTLPEELAKYQIFPNSAYRKHKFAGEP